MFYVMNPKNMIISNVLKERDTVAYMTYIVISPEEALEAKRKSLGTDFS